MPESPDTEAIAARIETAKRYMMDSWAESYAADCATLLAALATAEERRDQAEFQAEKYAAKAAAAEAVIEAARDPHANGCLVRRYSQPGGNRCTCQLANYHKATAPQAENEPT